MLNEKGSSVVDVGVSKTSSKKGGAWQD